MWNPHEIRRLIAQVAGIALGIGGFYLIVTGVQATGRINISSSFLSGELESGSAGLFLLFLSFLMIVLPSMFGSRSSSITSFPIMQAGATTTPNPLIRLTVVTAVLIAITFLFIFGGEYLEKQYGLRAGSVIFFVGLLGGMVSIFLLFVLVGVWIELNQGPAPKARSTKKEE